MPNPFRSVIWRRREDLGFHSQIPQKCAGKLAGQCFTPAVRTARAAAIAPTWHTASVLIALLGFSWVGALVDLNAVFGTHWRVLNYLLVMVFEWATVAFIWWELDRRGTRLSAVVGDSWTRGMHVLRDFCIGIAFILIFGGAIQGIAYLLHAAPPQAMHEMMPHTWLEMSVWVPLSVTAGFCEEVIFRGYLQRQFSALTQSQVGGIVLQAIAFGLGHGYQGWKLMSLIALYGACFGSLAHWRRSLRPGMIAHALQDTAGGLLARLLTN